MSKVEKIKKFFKGNFKFAFKKNSILWRWSAANAIFFFIAITLVALVSYLVMMFSVIGSNNASMKGTLDSISVRLSKSDRPLTKQNLNDFLNNFNIPTGSWEGGELLQSSDILSQMISSRNMNFYFYNVDHHMFYRTNSDRLPFQSSGSKKITSYKFDGNTGYLGWREIRSEKTGEVIGYIAAFYDLSNFYSLSQKMLIAFIVITFISLIVSVFFGYQLTKHFIKPLRRIGESMEKVAAHPEEAFVPVRFEKDKIDEITQIADFYNQMMGHVNYYIEQQRGFVSDASHELRTPLAVIDGHLHLLERWGKDDPKVMEESHRVIIEEVSNMKRMLEGMLALSRLEQKKLPSEYRTKVINPVTQVEIVLGNFSMMHPEFSAHFINKLSEDCRMLMDEGHYVQALMILLNNAAKYSPDSHKSITIELNETEDFVVTSVADKGMGMSKEDANLIFERFFRADKARNREIGGTGLGLPILANIVKQYGGGIVEVETELNKGSKFTFKIPKVK
ncbi:MAG: HAMP domain-containing histidine kinase [Streptococcaceae bacterium]|jgi:signal transduction histidine kinase|nr:HAMP domain-containing histidine kinase [Streptococcaceae bacterium]